jgi:hypothetical protein
MAVMAMATAKNKLPLLRLFIEDESRSVIGGMVTTSLEIIVSQLIKGRKKELLARCCRDRHGGIQVEVERE